MKRRKELWKPLRKCVLEALDLIRREDSLKGMSFASQIQAKRTFFNVMWMCRKYKKELNRFDFILMQQYIVEYVNIHDAVTEDECL